MTERGLPLADGATACPFVAYDDDRDERSSVPDHRHRCFAEPSPAPRALAHQEAYCLSSAFPVCPTFQDWARREAARSRDGSGAAAAAARASDRAAGDRGSADPPVVAPGLAAAAAAAATGLDLDADGAGTTAMAPAAGLTGSERDPEPDADGFDDPHPAAPDDLVRRNPPRDWAAPPPWLASNEAGRDDDADPPSFLGRRVAEPGAGLAGSAADRMAGGAAPRPRDRDEDWTSSARTAPPPRTAARRDVPDDAIEEESDEDERDDASHRPARRPRAYAQHLGGTDGPDWERPRRYEAYPTIRSRVGLPRLPRIAIAAVALVILALALFFLPGMLNIGGAGKPVGSAAASAKPVPSVSVAPTAPPEPTPQLYTIRKGETLLKIATRNGLTLEDLLAANPSIKNPDKVGEGQQIIIPVPSEAPPDDGEASTAP